MLIMCFWINQWISGHIVIINITEVYSSTADAMKGDIGELYGKFQEMLNAAEGFWLWTRDQDISHGNSLPIIPPNPTPIYHIDWCGKM